MDSTWTTLLVAQERKCFYCGKTLRKHTKDHFFPKSWGHTLVGNVVFSCSACNSKKCNHPPTVEEIVRFVELYEFLGWAVPVYCVELVIVYRITKWMNPSC